MTPLYHPFDTHNTIQLQKSSVGKLDNFMVSYTVSLVKVVIMCFICIIGWIYLSLDTSGILLIKFGLDITFISSNFRSLCSLDFPNCQCRLVEPSFHTVTQMDIEATIALLLLLE